jgi:sulfate adenylyltransferase subunit 2
MLYSIGKDSSVLLHLAIKAFSPAPIPFSLLHIDTTWKFSEMIEFRNNLAEKLDLDIKVFTNQDGVKQGMSPFTHGSELYTDVMKTQALKMALDLYKPDFILAGARRDEEASRSKERIFSIRGKNHSWDPKKQRAEFWNLFNGSLSSDQTMRVFPLSNWTEENIWEYIRDEQIEIPQLYFSKKRKYVLRDNNIIYIDDERIEIAKGETVLEGPIRFRTLGCYPLTAAVKSNATTIDEIISEILENKTSERSGRLIDSDTIGSMEKKKKEGYF